MTQRVMVVEDDEDLRESLTLLLERPGRALADFGDGASALRAFEAGSFDVVVTDVGLPGMSGLELADRVHALRPATWVVIASGAFTTDAGPDERRLRRIAKPFPVEQLDALIDELCRADQR